MAIRNLLLSGAILCAAGVMPLAAQETRHSAVVPTTGPASTSQLGPRLPAPFVSVQTKLPETMVARAHDDMDDDGQHTIVISTLALVLGVIVLVLLIAR